MTITEQLRELLNSAAKPDHAAFLEHAKSPLVRLGYAVGFHDGVSEAIEIAENEEGDE